MSTDFFADADLAQRLRVSKSCIRGQRFKRKAGESHWLKLNPVYIGKCPRYRRDDVDAWLAALPPAELEQAQ